MPMPELFVKKGSNLEEYVFEIKDAKGNARNVTAYTVKLYIVDRISRAVKMTKDLTQVSGSGNEHKVKWTTATADVPAVGFYDGELFITSGGGYVEPYDEFPVTIEESATSTPADKAFESWL